MASSKLCVATLLAEQTVKRMPTNWMSATELFVATLLAEHSVKRMPTNWMSTTGENLMMSV